MNQTTSAPQPNYQGLLPFRDPKSLLLSAEPWKSVIFLLVTFGLGFALSSALFMMLAMSIVLSLVIVGIPLLAATIVLWTYLAQIERARITLLTGIEIPRPYRELPEEGILGKAKVFITDPAVWKDLVYLLLLFPVGVVQLIIVFIAITTPLSLIGSPIAVLIGDSVTVQQIEITSPGQAAVAALVGVVMLPLAAYLVTIIARGHGLVARWILGPSRTTEAEGQVGTQGS